MAQIAIPNLNTQQELAHVMQQSRAFADADVQRAIKEIEESTGGQQIGVGIQSVLTAIQTASQDEDRAGRFAEVMSEAIAEGTM